MAYRYTQYRLAEIQYYESLDDSSLRPEALKAWRITRRPTPAVGKSYPR